jgi:UDP:flavonoid glycosyltransferase YjiC (YdhE family)
MRPMNVLVTASPAAGHLWDVVPVAWALRSRGHDVRIATLPAITAHVIQTSLPALPAGPAARPPGLPADDAGGPGGRLASSGETAARMSGLLAAGLIAALPGFTPDLVVHEPMELAGPLIAERLGIPCVHQSSGPPPECRFRQVLREAGAELRRGFGMDPQVRSPSLVIDVCPPGFQVGAGQMIAAPHQPMRYVPFLGPADVPAWLHEQPRQLRLCAAGALARPEGGGPAVLSRIAGALRQAGLEVLLPLPAACAAGPRFAGSGARVVGWAPLHLVAGGCDLIMHRGDPATTLTALRAGVVQLVMPAPGDLPADTIARLLEASGAGCAIDPPAMTDGQIAESVRGMLSDGRYRQSAAEVAADIARQPSPADVAGVIENLAARGASG